MSGADRIIPRVRELALLIGVNVDDPMIEELLGRDRLNSYEAGRIINRAPSSIQNGIKSGRLRCEPSGAHGGEQVLRRITPLHLLEWAVSRPAKDRYADPVAAYLNADAKGEADKLPQWVQERWKAEQMRQEEAKKRKEPVD